MGKINSEYLRELPIGSKTELLCESPRHCESVRTMAYRIPKLCPEHKNKKYRCIVDYAKSTVTIEVSDKRKEFQTKARRVIG